MTNPFDPQNPSHPKYFYGRSEVRERYNENIKYGLDGQIEHMALIGEWGIGKTSLLQKLHSIEVHNSVTKTYIPLNAADVEDFSDFASCIVLHISKRLKKINIGFEIDKINLKFIEIRKSTPENEVMEFTDDMMKLYSACGEGNHLLALFIDDLHLAAHHRNEIRNCFQELGRRGCNYMVVGTLIPELFEEGEINAPFKRMFTEHPLSEFSEQESRNMINHITTQADVDVTLSNSLYSKLYEETGGHPHYLTLYMNELIREKETGKLTLAHYNRREPMIMDRMKVNFDNKFNLLTENDEKTLKKLVTLEIKEFSPSDVDSNSSQLKQLVEPVRQTHQPIHLSRSKSKL